MSDFIPTHFELTSLKDMRLFERLEHGVYKGDSEKISPSTLAQYCAEVNGDAQSMTKRITGTRIAHSPSPC